MLICSPEQHLLRKIWVWFRAVRFVMCRQPQQKSGSKQPWSNWYDHQTEEAMPLVRIGKERGKERGRGEASATGCTYHQPKVEKCPFLMYYGDWGNRCVGMLKREGKRKSGPEATNLRTINKKWFSSLVSYAIEDFILRQGPGLGRGARSTQKVH